MMLEKFHCENKPYNIDKYLLSYLVFCRVESNHQWVYFQHWKYSTKDSNEKEK